MMNIVDICQDMENIAQQQSRDEYEAKLRDQFACAALTGLVGIYELHKHGAPSSFACESYKMADAMLAERKK